MTQQKLAKQGTFNVPVGNIYQLIPGKGLKIILLTITNF
jgi:hypothetical protein